MSDTLLTRWSGRADPKQTRVYNHQTPDQLNAKFHAITKEENSKLGIAELVIVTPETLQEINADSNITAHVTEFGMCIHSYVLNPCEKHRDCVNCEEQVCEKGDDEKLKRLKEKLKYEEMLLTGDQQAMDDGSVNAEIFLNKRLLTIERCKALIDRLEDDSIPDRKVYNQCIVEGCDNKHLAKGYCSKHYMQIKRKGKIIPDKNVTIGCIVEDCDNKHLAKGYCNKHYQQMRRLGKITPGRKGYSKCSVTGCDIIHYAKGYCNKHYYQVKKHGIILPDKKVTILCIVDGCDRKHRAKGYCGKHYTQIKRTGKISTKRKIHNLCSV
jgi:hypothetical protein